MLKFLYSKPLPKDIARDRLKLIIVNDRDGVTPYVLDIIKNEILTIILKYIDIDIDKVSFKIHKNNEIDVDLRSSTLILTLPLNNSYKNKE